MQRDVPQSKIRQHFLVPHRDHFLVNRLSLRQIEFVTHCQNIGNIFHAAFKRGGRLLLSLGAFVLFKENRQTALLLLSFPICYFVYFSLQSAMVVRNLLALTPFLAVLAARGVMVLWHMSRPRRLQSGAIRFPIARLALALAIGGCLLINAGWLVYAAQTIADHHSDKFIRAVARHISAERETRFYLSPRLQIQVRDVSPAFPPNIVDDPAMADRVLLYAGEGFEHWQDWPANNPWLTEQWFGPYEVNFNIYPNWWGDDRIIELTEARARKLGILLVRTAATKREQ